MKLIKKKKKNIRIFNMIIFSKKKKIILIKKYKN